MSNTHVLPNTTYEVQAMLGDLLSPAILATTLAVPVPPSLTLPAFTTTGYVRSGTPTQLVYVNQPAISVTLAGSDGPYWIALHKDTHTTVTDWTRRFGSHYLWRAAATRPADPPGGLVLAGMTVSGGNITAVDPAAAGSAPYKRVAYGGPQNTLTYAPRLIWDDVNHRLSVNATASVYSADTKLDVQGMTVLNGPVGIQRTADAAYSLVTQGNTYVGGTLGVTGATALSSTLNIYGLASCQAGLNVSGQVNLTGDVAHTGNNYTTGQVRAVGSLYVDGTSQLTGAAGLGGAPDSRFTLRNYGTLYCDGYLGIWAVPRWQLEVGGHAYVSGCLGLWGLTPDGAYGLRCGGPAYLGTTVQIAGRLDGTDAYFQGHVQHSTSSYFIGDVGMASTASINAVLQMKGINSGIRWANVGDQLGDGMSYEMALGWKSTGQMAVRVGPTQAGIISMDPPSDARLKTAIARDVPGLAVVQVLEPISFAYTETADCFLPPGRHYGLVAQEAQPVVPGLVQAKGHTDYLYVDYIELIPILVQAVQKLAQRLETLEGRL